MNIRRQGFARALVATAGLFAAACQAQTPAPPPGPASLTDADQATIRQASAAAEKAVLARDFAAWSATYTDDGVVLPPNGEAVQGRPALEVWAATFPPITEFSLQQTEIDGRGDLAYARGVYTMTLAVPGAPAPVPDRGKYIEIWRKQADGSWKIARDIFNSDLPATPPPPPAPVKK